MRKIKTEIMIVGSIVVLIGAYGIGLSIRNVRFMMAENRAREFAAQATLSNEVEIDKPAQPATPEIRYVVTQEPVEEFRNETIEPAGEQNIIEPQVAWEESQAIRSEPEVAWNNNQWGNWANNLTEQQRSRLEQGMASMWERWQNFSPEEAQAEQNRMTQMWQNWQNMDDRQRQQVMQGMQQQFQQWLDSDQIELPVFSWD
ncbi:MAG: hypothetical protein JW715_00635 [Sedimentisphaerales bacterium]|nr:hypothetical protein [Sedimentisphaerales bacterium]